MRERAARAMARGVNARRGRRKQRRVNRCAELIRRYAKEATNHGAGSVRSVRAHR